MGMLSRYSKFGSSKGESYKKSSLLTDTKAKKQQKATANTDFSKLSMASLSETEITYRQELQKVRFQVSLGIFQQVHKIMEIKKNIARVLTYQKQISRIQANEALDKK